MSKNRDDEPAYIFCSAETKVELAKRSGDDMPPDEVFVVADVVQPGMYRCYQERTPTVVIF